MTRRLSILVGVVPCMLAVASVGFAQTGATTTAATTTNTAVPAVTAAPTTTGTGTTAVTTTTTTAAPSADVVAAPVPVATRLPHTGGEPAMFAIVGSAFSLAMLGLRRRFNR